MATCALVDLCFKVYLFLYLWYQLFMFNTKHDILCHWYILVTRNYQRSQKKKVSNDKVTDYDLTLSCFCRYKGWLISCEPQSSIIFLYVLCSRNKSLLKSATFPPDINDVASLYILRHIFVCTSLIVCPWRLFSTWDWQPICNKNDTVPNLYYGFMVSFCVKKIGKCKTCVKVRVFFQNAC